MRKEQKKIRLDNRGLPYTGGVVAGNTVYFPDGSAIDKAAVQVSQTNPTAPNGKGTAKGSTLKQRVLKRWRG